MVYVLTIISSAALCLVDGVGLMRADWPLVAQGLASPATLAVFFVRTLLLLASFVLIIGGYIFLIRWLRRAYYNLHQLPNIHPDYSDGWAAGAWFVPFVNLVRPFTIMREVWKDTQLAAFGEVRTPATLLGLWWSAYLINGLLAWIASLMDSGRSSGTGALDGEIASHAFTVLTAALTWLVVRRIAGFEEALASRLKIAELGQAPPAPALVGDQSDYGEPEGY